MVCEDREEKPVLKALQLVNRMQSKGVEVRRKDAWADHRCAKSWFHTHRELQVNH